MRWVMLFVTGVVIVFININSKMINKFDNKIFELYTNNFDQYLYVDNYYDLQIDKKKMSEDLKEYGEIIFYKNILHFVVKFGAFKEKEYYFYLEKYNEK